MRFTFAALIVLVAGGSIACSTGEPLVQNLNPDATGDGPLVDPDGFRPDVAEAAVCETSSDAKIKCPSGRPPPAVGAKCGPGQGDCLWPGACGIDHFLCCGKWVLSGEQSPPCSVCPSAPPTMGAGCASPGIVCSYLTSPGKYCDRTSWDCTEGVWDWTGHPCAPDCPATKPTNDAKCPLSAEGKYCEWASSCHSMAYALCTDGKWGVTVPCP